MLAGERKESADFASDHREGVVRESFLGLFWGFKLEESKVEVLEEWSITISVSKPTRSYIK